MFVEHEGYRPNHARYARQFGLKYFATRYVAIMARLSGQRKAIKKTGEPGHWKSPWCPLDQRVYDKWLVEPHLDGVREGLIDGIHIDWERYGGGGEAGICYCDDCFATFLSRQDIQVALPDKADRFPWLEDRDRVDDYEENFHRRRVEMFTRIRETLQAVNPRLLWHLEQSNLRSAVGVHGSGTAGHDRRAALPRAGARLSHCASQARNATGRHRRSCRARHLRISTIRTCYWFSAWREGDVRLAEWPRDRLGYARPNAGPKIETPHLWTSPLRSTSGVLKVFLNVEGISAPHGVAVAVTDERFVPLDGFDAGDCGGVENGLRSKVRWRGGQTAPTTGPVRLRIDFTNRAAATLAYSPFMSKLRTLDPVNSCFMGKRQEPRVNQPWNFLWQQRMRQGFEA